MLKALDDLERAVTHLLEKGQSHTAAGSISRDMEETSGRTVSVSAPMKADEMNEEAAELVRRAIKRLKSL